MTETSPSSESEAFRRWGRILRPVLTVVAVVFVAFAAHSLAQRWDNQSVRLRPFYLVLSIVPLAMGPAPALAAALVSRAVSLVADVLAWAVARFFLRGRP